MGSEMESGQSHVFFELCSFHNSWIMNIAMSPGSLENVDCIPLFSHSESSASMSVFGRRSSQLIDTIIFSSCFTTVLYFPVVKCVCVINVNS